MESTDNDGDPNSAASYAEAIGPDSDEVQREMETRSRREDFPIVGRVAGGWLMQIAAATDARRIIEMGSGYGYSASWWARALPEDGEILLTERDEDLLEDAENYLERADYGPDYSYLSGDALETAEELDGSFDVAFIDVDKPSYPDAFHAVRDRITSGGVVVADNVMWAGDTEEGDVVNYPALAEVYGDPERSLDDVEMPEDAEPGTRGVLDYLRETDAAPEFSTTLLPVDDGLSVSVRQPTK